MLGVSMAQLVRKIVDEVNMERRESSSQFGAAWGLSGAGVGRAEAPQLASRVATVISARSKAWRM